MKKISLFFFSFSYNLKHIEIRLVKIMASVGCHRTLMRVFILKYPAFSFKYFIHFYYFSLRADDVPGVPHLSHQGAPGRLALLPPVRLQEGHLRHVRRQDPGHQELLPVLCVGTNSVRIFRRRTVLCHKKIC